MLSIRSCIYILLSLTWGVLSALQFQKPEDLPAIDYDFIVVGGGNAGVVVASRLSENHDLKVLVIEAGPSNDEVFDSQVPGLLNNIGFGTRVDWNYSTTPQTHVNGKVSTYGRAMLLGGCSSHNSMAYTRGSRDDYDRWASIADDENLSWNNILPYILKTEQWSGPNDPSLSEQGHFDPSVHSFHGKVGVSAPYEPHPFNDLLFEATKTSEGDFPFLLDLNNGRPIGIGWGQATVVKGFRSSSATGYLPHTNDNLHVLLNTRVTRILPVDPGNNHNGPSLRKVEFAASAEAPRHTLAATKEVILSGGMINTPQILLNSGIGPKDDLERMGINTLLDNPSVGQNFTDQVSISINFATNLAVTDFNETTAFAEWTTSHTGPLAGPTRLGPLGWIRFPDDADVFSDGSPDPTAGQNSPHVEFFFGGISMQSDPNGIGNPPPPTRTTGRAKPGLLQLEGGQGGQGGNISFGMIVVNVHPLARGSITINSSSPFSPPIVDPNLLGSPVDTSILIEGILSAQRLFALPAFSKNMFGLTAPESSSSTTPTKEELATFIETRASPFGHGVGSCSMAPHGATWGVVDPEFRVRGAQGLRIVDASVIPYITSGHTQAPVYAIAEWASTVIKRAWE